MTADAVRDGIPCMLMRAGTSKGAFFLADDLPSEPAVRDDLMLRIMGSPDRLQTDGLGGAHPLTSKVAIVGRSEAPGIDLDYLFLQVVVDEPAVGATQTCGNMLAGVGPFAVERGLVAAASDMTTVTIRLVNTGSIATATLATPGGMVSYDGDVAIAGVPGTAGGIDLELTEPPGKALLPTGNLIDEVAGHRATLIDAGMPVVLLDASEFGLVGDETPARLEADASLATAVEQVRLAAGSMMDLGDVSEQTVPKAILLSPPRAEGAICTRAFIPRRVHTAIGVLMAASVVAGIRIPGTIGSELAVAGDDDHILVEHPSGVFAAHVRVHRDADGQWSASSLSRRTARKIFDGRVFARPRL